MVIAVTDLMLRRQGRVILGPVTITLADRGLTVVLGPNGAGKSSLLRALHGLERLSAGRIDWPAGKGPDRQAFVFQQPILMRRSVVECVAYPLLLSGTGRTEARDRAVQMATRLGLGHRLDQPAQVLSGGERQKMALARALIGAPAVLFLDEPCAALDGRSTRDIETILTEERDRGTRIIMSTHNVGQARRLADEAVFLHDARLVAHGPCPAFFDDAPAPEVAAWARGDILA